MKLELGRTEQNRPIDLLMRTAANEQLRILIFAGQHGDERGASHAVRDFYQNSTLPSGLSLAAIPTLNADGAALKQRRNVNHLDLNRDHQRLRSGEVQQLHHFVSHWRPHLIIDVHNYPSRRKMLMRHGYIFAQDLFLDVPNNPSLAPFDSTPLLERFKHSLRAQGFEADHYILINKLGRVRHGTPDMIDARNGMTLRFGVPTLLLEGRAPVKSDDRATRQHLHNALLSGLTLLVEWAAEKAALLKAYGRAAQAGDVIVVASRYVEAEPLRLRLRRLDSPQVVEAVTLPYRYTPHLTATRVVALPIAYAVPKSCQNLLTTLRRHPLFEWQGAGIAADCQSYRVYAMQPSVRKHRPPYKLVLSVHHEHCRLDDFVLFPIAGNPGRWLAAMLEPTSKYGLVRYPALLPLAEGEFFAVKRVVAMRSR